MTYSSGSMMSIFLSLKNSLWLNIFIINHFNSHFDLYIAIFENETKIPKNEKII